MSKYCEKCGTENQDNSEFCLKCGRPFQNVPQTDKEYTYQYHQEYSAAPQEQKNGRGKSIAGFILSLFGIFCGITAIIGFILSIIGISESKKSGKVNGLAVAGLIISSLYFLLVILAIFGVILPAKDITVADFSTMSRAEAREWCEEQDANCYFKEEYSNEVSEGNFISQSVDYGETVKSYTSIYITYSKGEYTGTTNSSESSNSSKAETTPSAPAKTAEEIKNEYKEQCQSYGYKDIARQPDNYVGKKAKFRGKVIQVSEGIINSKKVTLRVDVTQGEYGWWDDTVYVTYTYKSGEPKILEDDIINMYGTLEGSETYVSVLGANITIPSFKAKYIDIEQ